MAREYRIEEIRVSTQGHRKYDFGIARPLGSGRPVQFTAPHGMLQLSDVATGEIKEGKLFLNKRLRPSGMGTFSRTWKEVRIYY